MALLARDKSLKPTTAIHLSGVTDPSVVRRLRDKLKVAALSIPAPNRKSRLSSGRARSSTVQPMPPAETDIKAVSSAPLPETPSANEGPANQDTASQSSPHSQTFQSTVSSPPETGEQARAATTQLADPQLEALKLAAEAAAAVSRLYLHCMNYALQTNPMSLALRSQTVMSEWIAGMIRGAAMAAPSQDKK